MSQFKESFLIKAEDVKLFADVAGDPNPIHQDNEVAKKMGLEGAIAHGMFVYSYLLRRLDEWILLEKQKGKSWEIASAKCRFHEPALVGKTFESVLELSDADADNPKMNMYFMDGEKKLCHVLVVLSARK